MMERKILSLLWQKKRLTTRDACKTQGFCQRCLEAYVPPIRRSIARGEPLSMILPAFPAKSPSLRKVLGVLPDMADFQALKSLEELCEAIREVYKPGAHIIICSDGRVFNQVLGIADEVIKNYLNGLKSWALDLGFHNLSFFGLEDLERSKDPNFLRQELLQSYGTSELELRQKILRGSQGSSELADLEAKNLYCGMTRFLVEDFDHRLERLSRTQLQKRCKEKALSLIQLSQAWGAFLAERFPEALRLSIHPQVCGAKKMGIRLLNEEGWITPWHGVAVLKDGAYVLMKRAEAESQGYELRRDQKGRHYFAVPETHSKAQELRSLENASYLHRA